MNTTQNLTKKIGVKEVWLCRAEGPTVLCGKKVFFDDLSKASSWLLRQSRSFPESGGYDKVDFCVTFEDGFIYAGRLDCKRASQPDNDLDVAKHIREHVLHCERLQAGIVTCKDRKFSEKYDV